MEVNLAWFDKRSAAEAIGCSTKTVAKMAQDGVLRWAIRKRPGLAPCLIFHPEDVNRERLVRNPDAKPCKAQDVSRHVGPSYPRQGVGDALRAKLGSAMSVVQAQYKLFLTFDEATAYSGLPAAFLRDLIQGGKLRVYSVGEGDERIRRGELELLRL